MQNRMTNEIPLVLNQDTLYIIKIICQIWHELVASIEHVAYLLVVGKVMGSMLGPNCVRDKHSKSCTYCCYVRYAILIV